MIWHNHTGNHDVYYRGVIRDKNVLLISINFFLRFFYQFITETHSIKHGKTPQSDKEVAILIMFWIYGEYINEYTEKCSGNCA